MVSRLSTQHSVAAKDSGPLELLALTFAICSNRLDKLNSLLQENRSAIGIRDLLIIVLDLPNSTEVLALASQLEAQGVRLIRNGANRGLSFSRNRVLDVCETNYLIFLDDDTSITQEVVESIRDGFAQSYEIIGVRLSPPIDNKSIERWFLSSGQLHYLGLHPTNCRCTTWGACMGIDLRFVRRNSLRFSDNLGRHGTQLRCGDDTTFLAQMCSLGAREKFLDNLHAIHHIAPERLKLSYLLRRAFWQGRSEFRRQQAISGLRKEWQRNLNSSGPWYQRVGLSLLYIGFVLIGILVEISTSSPLIQFSK